jgi:hypothetical protein
VVAPNRKLTEVPRIPWYLKPWNPHGFRGSWDLEVPRVGVEHKPFQVTRLPWELSTTESVPHWTTYVLNVRLPGQPNPSCTCVHDGPNTLPQLDYGVTQIGDCVVTQRPRARVVMADRQNGTLTQIGK